MDDDRDVSALQPVAFERHLRDLLAGVRLIGEVDVEGPLYERAREIAEGVVANELAVAGFARSSPATLAYYLVATAAQHADGGELWPYVPFATDDGKLQGATGKGFRDALVKFGLETFDDLVRGGARRNLTPILTHAMVNRPGCGRLLTELIDEMKKGARGASEVLITWRQTETGMDGLSTPVRRFIERGDEVALDIIDRYIDYLTARAKGTNLTSRDFGLPGFVDEEYDELDSHTRASTPVPKSPVPWVEFDPWSGEGPQLVLPEAHRIDEWVVAAGGEQYRFSAGIRNRSVDIEPNRALRVDALQGGAVDRRQSFSLDSPVLLFDYETGVLLDRQDVVTTDHVTVVHTAGIELRVDAMTGSAVPSEEHPELFGVWSAYRSATLDLRTVRRISVYDTVLHNEVATITATAASRRIELYGSSVTGVTDASGRQVFDELPLVSASTTTPEQVRVQLTVEGTETVTTLADVTEAAPGLYRIADAAENVFGKVTIRIIGPLGTDLRTEIVVVPGLELDRPTSVVEPRAALRVGLRADESIELVGLSDGTIAFPPGDSSAQIVAARGGIDRALSVRIPRLAWSLGSATATHEGFHTTPIIVDRDDFDATTTSLFVRTGISTSTAIRLTDSGGALLQESDRTRTGKAQGRWRFGLERFSDTARHHEGDLTFQVDVAGRMFDVCHIRSIHRVLSVAADVVSEAGASVLSVLIEEPFPADHTIRLWSLDRPWEPPTEFAGETSSEGELRLEMDETPVSGRYVVEVATDGRDRRLPSHGDPATTQIQIDGADPEPCPITEIVGGTKAIGRLSDDDVTPHAPALFAVIEAAVRRLEPETVSRAEKAVEALFLPDDLFARVVTAESHGRDFSPTDRTRLGLLAITSAVDIPAIDLGQRELEDLWETNRLLAAAIDRPRDSSAQDRWTAQTGWRPSPTSPSLFARDDPELVNLTLAQLRDELALEPTPPPRLLEPDFFHTAQLDWLMRTVADRQPVELWVRRYGDLAGSKTCERFNVPQFAVEALKSGRSLCGPLTGNVAHAASAAALHLVAFGGDEARGRLALWELAELAPLLVQRQVIIALLLHLVATGQLDLRPTDS
ncbi:MAG: hypothetical protein RIE08_09010 [Acidimicrobiales bacterium]